MTELRIEPYEMPAADLGPLNPLPMFRGEAEDVRVEVDGAVTEEETRRFGWQAAWRVLPYQMQDGFNRVKRPRKFHAAILENERLRATFIPELGGRLISLVHRPAQRELLDHNPVFQPANLALRNAWFSGGIEWNAGQFGHHYRTCDPVFAAHVIGTQGEPVLRLYEWDRVKGFPYQIDFHLPPGSPFLFARVRLINPHDHELPMYWWTNIAVTETPDARVLCPAGTALHGIGTKLELTTLPTIANIDMTYTARVMNADECFFRIPSGHRPWIAHLDGEGRGLVHASTKRLIGRKMFIWGTGPGSRHWQEFVAVPGQAYLEIQAGLGRIQIESVPMPAHAEWTWTEAFGLLEANRSQVHGSDWQQAWQAAETALDTQLTQNQIESLDAQFATVTTRPADKLLAHGSGWGALERMRLKLTKQADHLPSELSFDNLGDEQAPWVTLLEKGKLPEQDLPGALMVDVAWQMLLEQALQAGRSDHWLAWWHLGNMRMESHDHAGAKAAWERSLKCRRTGWALRNLAVLDVRTSSGTIACELLRQAWESGPQIIALAVEYAQALMKSERYQEFRAFVAGLPANFRQHDRLQLLNAQVALKTGHLDEVVEVFHHDFALIQESEVTLTDIWFDYQERRIAGTEKVPLDDELRQRVRREFPLPTAIDFRMSG